MQFLCRAIGSSTLFFILLLILQFSITWNTDIITSSCSPLCTCIHVTNTISIFLPPLLLPPTHTHTTSGAAQGLWGVLNAAGPTLTRSPTLSTHWRCWKCSKWTEKGRGRSTNHSQSSRYNVSSILSQRRRLKGSGLVVKPDLNKQERLVDQILMKKRWALIQSGNGREQISIRGGSLFVNKIKKGSVVSGAYVEYECNVVA